MKNRLATWSWILPIVNIIYYFLAMGLFEIIGLDDGGIVPTSERLIWLAFAIIFLAIAVTGLVFGVKGLKNINASKVQSLIGIILNVLLILVGLLLVLGGLMGG